ncbi:hypothetical protein CTAYLR_008159 [Chrysophaeum taylorii]|uniref:MoaB/Mog domain-containing protein n=1 Tax=Chrysophaeum taylorii TaxID=2483200 RepID=A0AAD7XPA7_9STRA|nr:hypothetical protein CTAYLR_008159 [Chrysophaeum taylorii]
MEETTYPMRGVNEALGAVLACCAPLEEIEVPAKDACGYVVCEDVVAPAPYPFFDTTISDGYAVRSAETPCTLRVGYAVLAGNKPPRPLDPGECCYVATGAPLPEGADAVCDVESAAEAATSSSVESAAEAATSSSVRVPVVPKGKDVRRRGSDHEAGEVLIPRGAVLRPWDLGILATVGRDRVRVRRRPRVKLFSTGDELRGPYDPACKVRDANRPALEALLGGAGDHEGGAIVVDGGIVADSPEALGAALDADCDVLVTTGGVSVGRADFAKPLLEARGAKIHFGRLHMKPGKPTTFATLENGSLYFGLPGNPVSAVVTSLLLVVPALKKLRGFPRDRCVPPHLECDLGEDVTLDEIRPEYRRVRVDDFRVVRSTGFQRSSRLVSMHGADALAWLPDRRAAATSTLRAGARVSALLVSPLPPARPSFFFPERETTTHLRSDDDLFKLPRTDLLPADDHLADNIRLSDDNVSLIVVCGGIGLVQSAARQIDLVCDRPAPALARAMATALADPLQQPLAALRGTTLVIAVPENPTLSKRCLDAIRPALHAFLISRTC